MLALTVDWNLLSKYQGLASPWAVLPVVVVIAVSAWLIFQLKAWFRDNDGRTDDNLEMLTQFRELRQQGELSEDEYRLIKSRLVQATMASNPASFKASATATSATEAVQRRGGTENAGEAGQNDAGRCESRSSDESPNLNSAAQMQSETRVSGMSPDV